MLPCQTRAILLGLHCRCVFTLHTGCGYFAYYSSFKKIQINIIKLIRCLFQQAARCGLRVSKVTDASEFGWFRYSVGCVDVFMLLTSIGHWNFRTLCCSAHRRRVLTALPCSMNRSIQANIDNGSDCPGSALYSPAPTPLIADTAPRCIDSDAPSWSESCTPQRA